MSYPVAHYSLLRLFFPPTCRPIRFFSRDRNKKATIIVRCYLDEFTEILESLGANEVISSSKSAFNEIATHIGAVAAPS